MRIFALLPILLAATPALAQTMESPSLWHPMRPSVTTFGGEIDTLYWGIFWLTMIILIVVQAALIWFAVKYRANGGKAKFIHGNNRLELAWTVTPAIILVLIAAVSKGTWDDLRVDIPDDSVRIECIAQQFAWFFRYPGEDQTFGPRDYERLAEMRAQNDTSDPWAVDREAIPADWEGENPPGVDDYTVEGTLRMPADRPVRILLTSNDVLHSFFVPEFRTKHDAVPGMNGGRLWFEVDWEKAKDREYFDLVCTELCGLNHYSMRGKVIVLPTGDIDPWVEEKTGAELLELRDYNDEEFLERVMSNDTTYETFELAMSKIAEAENSGGDDGYGGGYGDY